MTGGLGLSVEGGFRVKRFAVHHDSGSQGLRNCLDSRSFSRMLLSISTQDKLLETPFYVSYENTKNSRAFSPVPDTTWGT